MNETLQEGRGGERKLILRSADGASAEIYSHGAHLTSWIAASGSERIFLSERSIFAPGSSIRGGVPVIFPQFNKAGPLPKHGFARGQEWTLVSHSESAALFALEENAASLAVWPHRFRCELAVSIGGAQLSAELKVTNTGDAPFTFTAALHSYLRVGEIADVRVEGLQGVRYRDSTQGQVEHVESSDSAVIEGEVDRVYFDAPAQVAVVEPGKRLTIAHRGFVDTVVWNPGAKLGATLADLDPEGYRHYLCVEAASIGRPVTLAPGARWQGSQTLVAS